MTRRKGKGRGQGGGAGGAEGGPGQTQAAQEGQQPGPSTGRGRGRDDGRTEERGQRPTQVVQQQQQAPTMVQPIPSPAIPAMHVPRPPAFGAQTVQAGPRPATAAPQPTAGPRPPWAVPGPQPTAAAPPTRPAAAPKAEPPAEQPTAAAVRPKQKVVEEITQSMSVVSFSSKGVTRGLDLPQRPGFGTLGRKIRLVSNHFPMQIPDGYIYHYDVEIESLRIKEATPDKLAKEAQKKATPQQVSGKRLSIAISREVMQNLFSQQDIFKGILPAYDGNKSLFTRKPISVGKRFTKIVSFKEAGRDIDSHFKVSIQPVIKDGSDSNTINLNCLHQLFKGRGSATDECLQAVMALDIVMRCGPALKLTEVGRSFFLPPRSQDEVHPLSEGKQVWFGHYQTIRPGQWKPMIILDKASTTFYQKDSLIGYACTFLRLRDPGDLVRLNDADIKRLSNDLRNVQIVVTHLPYRRKYRIVRITRQSASELKFPETQPDGTIVQRSVAEYFSKTYKPLRNPNLPCVQVNPENKKIYQPMEVCEVVEGQHYKRKLTEDQTSEMIKFTATPPASRFNDIQRAMEQTLEHNQRYIKEFGLQIERRPLHLDARVIVAPHVLYGGQKTVTPDKGSWDLRDTKFLRGAQISSWAIVCLASDRFCTMQNLRNFERMIQTMGIKMDMRIEQPKATIHSDSRQLKTTLQNMLRTHKLDLAVIVLRDRASYPEIKQIAEVQLGLRTSCIQSSNVVKKCTPQLVANVLLKMNAKLGGQNSQLLGAEIVPILKKPVIIIGVDVSHSSPGDRVKPSVAAAVGSLDSVLHHYAACIKLQKNRDENKQHLEIVDKLEEMVVELLKAFYKNTRFKPEKIIVYRDGVSEGEFSTVQYREVNKIREACDILQKDGTYKPGITFIVVQKRHHTRFTPENSREGVGRAGNIPPGTVVDKEIIHPVDHDFFLCSHFGIQGTSRPAHYTVLWDDNNLSADDVQQMSYQLCHTYVRCTRSISIPAPVMYAHLAALRARQHLASVAGHSDSSSDSSIEPEIDDSFRSAVKIADVIRQTMYYV